MKLTIGGNWDIELLKSEISKELEKEIKKAVLLTKHIDKKVKDTDNGNTTGSDPGLGKGQ